MLRPIRPTESSPYVDRRANGVTQVQIPTIGSLLSGFFLLPNLNSGTSSGARVNENLSHRFETTLTGRVVEVLENGDLRVEGRRHVTLNGDAQSLTLRGVVRPNDLDPDNRPGKSSRGPGRWARASPAPAPLGGRAADAVLPAPMERSRRCHRQRKGWRDSKTSLVNEETQRWLDTADRDRGMAQMLADGGFSKAPLSTASRLWRRC